MVNGRALRRILVGYLLLLVPLAVLAARYDRYAIDGDAVAYMDIADLLRSHDWSGAVNGYWHPLYPALLAISQTVSHATRWNELAAFYAVNIAVFLLQVAAMLLLVRALVRLREKVAPGLESLLSADLLRLFGVALLVVAMQRELSLGKVRTDGLLQALILFAIAFLMEALAAEGVAAFGYAALMGLALGLGYLTKSFAFLLAILCAAALMGFGVWARRRRWTRAALQSCTALAVFALVAGPYIAALSHQKGRFDFGDSGNLNYAWYISGTERTHLQPGETARFGSATVNLLHPEKQLLKAPGVYGYGALAHGTYPPWFDPTYWNERITPKFSLPLLLRRDARNVVLIFRYLLNHPEPLLLLVLLCAMGGTLRGIGTRWRFAAPSVAVGALMWAIYAMVNVEERYVTAAYLLVLLPVFAALTVRPALSRESARTAAVALVLLFSFAAFAEQGREIAENRRVQSSAGDVPAWRDRQIFGAAESLGVMGVHPGDSVACVGSLACINDFYWARLAGVRIVSELSQPWADHLAGHMDGVSNRAEVYRTLRETGAKVIVGRFDPGDMNLSHPGVAGWVRLGETQFYAYPLLEK